jgi:dTDP-4-dehydrorhamnose reductase
MRVLIVGAEGQLGSELCEAFSDCDLHRADLDGTGHQIDITDEAAVRTLVCETVKPDLVCNAAAMHNVVESEKQPDRAFAVNASGVKYLAQACASQGARIIHVSTDYVFGHGGETPYVETDLPAPLNVYAVSKLAGEHLLAAICPDHIIVRTAALYGKAPCRAKSGMNFVQLMLHLADTRPEVRVVTDEITTPTYANALARQMRLLGEKASPGLYHTTCQGACSWFEFAQAIFEETGTDVKLTPATAKELQAPVQRPSYSVLENARARAANLDIMPPWRAALRSYLTATHS